MDLPIQVTLKAGNGDSRVSSRSKVTGHLRASRFTTGVNWQGDGKGSESAVPPRSRNTGALLTESQPLYLPVGAEPKMSVCVKPALAYCLMPFETIGRAGELDETGQKRVRGCKRVREKGR